MFKLTIAIPTYNRSEYLSICLKSLDDALPDNYDELEILVIDNNSTDGTQLNVMKFQDRMRIRYIKNKSNIGPDENFKKCIKEASSKFVWIFGDDDVFFNGSISYILDIINTYKDVGLIHLRAKNFKNDDELLNYKLSKYHHEVINSKELFLKKVHTNISFISANIVNKKLLIDIDLNKIPNNNLGQVYWNMTSIIEARENIFCGSEIFAGRQFNSANYEFCKIFGESFMDILNLINDKYDVKPLIKIIKNRLLIFYYPANIARIRNEISKIKYSDNCFSIFYPKFKYNLYFWIFTVPAIILPSKITLYLVNFAEKIRK